MDRVNVIVVSDGQQVDNGVARVRWHAAEPITSLSKYGEQVRDMQHCEGTLGGVEDVQLAHVAC